MPQSDPATGASRSTRLTPSRLALPTGGDLAAPRSRDGPGGPPAATGQSPSVDREPFWQGRSPGQREDDSGGRPPPFGHVRDKVEGEVQGLLRWHDLDIGRTS